MSSLRDEDALNFQCNIEISETLLLRLPSKLAYGSLACSEHDANIATTGAARFIHNAVATR